MLPVTERDIHGVKLWGYYWLNNVFCKLDWFVGPCLLTVAPHTLSNTPLSYKEHVDTVCFWGVFAHLNCCFHIFISKSCWKTLSDTHTSFTSLGEFVWWTSNCYSRTAMQTWKPCHSLMHEGARTWRGKKHSSGLKTSDLYIVVPCLYCCFFIQLNKLQKYGEKFRFVTIFNFLTTCAL